MWAMGCIGVMLTVLGHPLTLCYYWANRPMWTMVLLEWCWQWFNTIWPNDKLSPCELWDVFEWCWQCFSILWWTNKPFDMFVLWVVLKWSWQCLNTLWPNVIIRQIKLCELWGVLEWWQYRVSKNVLYRVSEKYLKCQINNEPNHNTCNRMFDMCSSYCKNFIYISLSIAMWHGIIENWRITKMQFQRKGLIP